jgi:hypothetical protein
MTDDGDDDDDLRFDNDEDSDDLRCDDDNEGFVSIILLLLFILYTRKSFCVVMDIGHS